MNHRENPPPQIIPYAGTNGLKRAENLHLKMGAGPLGKGETPTNKSYILGSMFDLQGLY